MLATKLLCLFGVLQICYAQFFPSNENERCPQPPECPPLPAACINYLNQRQTFLQSRIPMITQNQAAYMQRQTLLNSLQPQLPLDQGLQQSVRIPSSSTYFQPVPPTFTPLGNPSIANNPALYNPNGIVGNGLIPPRQPPPGLGVLSINPLQPHTSINPANSAFNDCCGRCSMICRHIGHNNRAYHQKTGSIKRADNSCTHLELKTLMEKAVTTDPDESKRSILKSAEELYGGDFHVVCSTNDFTYVTKSSTYCQVTKENVTCYAFQTPLSQQQ